MIEAAEKDKNLVIEILSRSFIDNKSINFVIDNNKEKIPLLMDYCFNVGLDYGKIFLSNDKKGVIILLFPEKKKNTLKSILRDIRLAIKGIGVKRIYEVIKREGVIKKKQPKTLFIHLWYIGVYPNHSGKGIGSKLLSEVVSYCEELEKDIYLETSTIRNIPFYQRHNFKVVNKISSELPYELFILKRNLKKLR